MRNVRNLVLAAVAALAVACADRGLPTGPAEEAPSFHVTKTTARNEQLKQLLAVEKARLKRERELRKEEFEAAMAQWKILRKELKRARKLGSTAAALLRCQPRLFEGEAAIIGPEGGTLQIGEHELVIPRGALSQKELIVGEAPTSSLVTVEFQPEGLTFERPAELSLSYRGCEVPRDSDLLLAYLGQGNRILEIPISKDDRDRDEVTGEINHFSRYAVAY